MRDHLRITTGEIAIALRTFDDFSGLPKVMMNPADDVEISPKDDVVVLTRLHSRVIHSDEGRE
jgi:hypothetical protein